MVGGAIGVLTESTILGFTGGIISHMVLDAIPHETEMGFFDKPPETEQDKERFKRHKLYPTFVDIALLCIFFIFITLNIPKESYFPFFAGITGGLLPDFILSFTLKSRLLIMRKYFDFHHNLHFRLFKKPYVDLRISVIYQLAISIAAAYFIIKGKN